jgi:hypothetical protein
LIVGLWFKQANKIVLGLLFRKIAPRDLKAELKDQCNKAELDEDQKEVSVFQSSVLGLIAI